jgi:citrate synthase
MAKTPEQLLDDASAWWSTEIIDIQPGKIAIRGYPIQELIGRVRFPDMIWLMLRGELPSREQGDLLEAALVPGVDHGPHAPSIAIARMAVTCGLPVNGAMASAINVLDDVHGGAGQQCMELYRRDRCRSGRRWRPGSGGDDVIQRHQEAGEKIVPASAIASSDRPENRHRCSSSSPRRKANGAVSGRYASIGHAVEKRWRR